MLLYCNVIDTMLEIDPALLGAYLWSEGSDKIMIYVNSYKRETKYNCES